MSEAKQIIEGLKEARELMRLIKADHAPTCPVFSGQSMLCNCHALTALERAKLNWASTKNKPRQR
jgi:hypothetical protein